MATMAPLLISAALSAVSTASGMAQARQQDKAQKQAQAIQAQQAQSDIAVLEQQRAQSETERQARLEKTMAAQRAAFGASGVSSDGSAEAVFGNLLAESDREGDAVNADFDRRIASLQSGIRLNLLDRGGPDYIGMLAGFGQNAVRNWDRYDRTTKQNPQPGEGG